MTSPRHRKRQHANHHLGRQAVDLVRQRLPSHWIVRAMDPDYGLDLHVEVFDLLPDGSGSSDTLGEHFYVQVKGTPSLVTHTRQVGRRGNVAKAAPTSSDDDNIDIAVVKQTLDTGELLTVESMGAAVPALLCVVALDTGTVYFVCLNDYITKVLLPENPNYPNQGSHTIYLPGWNVLDPEDTSFAYIWLLARRGKLYAAFNTFHYQQVEIQYALDRGGVIHVDHSSGNARIDPEFMTMLRVFLRGNLRLDIWESSAPGYWIPLHDIREGFQRLLDDVDELATPHPEDDAQSFLMRTHWTMTRAGGLGRLYEEVIREWRLPTRLAAQIDDDPSSKYRP